MSNLLKFEDAANELGVGINNLYVQAVNKPIWYVKRYGVSYVDMKAFTRQRVLTGKCYEANTSELYWFMKELFKTDTAMSVWLAKMSSEYKSQSSWTTFMTTMFATPTTNLIGLRRTMHSEFFKVSYITVKLAIKKGVEFDGSDYQGYTEISA